MKKILYTHTPWPCLAQRTRTILALAVVGVLSNNFTPAIAQTISWNTTGIGGGGALFSPAVNPTDANEFYVACDMSEVFHTTTDGAAYNIEDFRQLRGFHNSKVCFTSNPLIRYCVHYPGDNGVPVKSVDGGATWVACAGNPDNTEEVYGLWADYNSPLRLIMQYYGDVYFSNDGGVNFTGIHTALNMGAGVIVGGVWFEGNDIYVSTNDGLLHSGNGGTSFSTITTSGIPAGEVPFSFAAAREGGTLRFMMLTGTSGNTYCGVQGSDYWGFFGGVYRMDNVSGTWIPKINGITINTDYPMFIGMAENDIDTVYIGGSNSNGNPNIMRSFNGGDLWAHCFNTSNNQNIVTGWEGESGDKAWSWSECLFGMNVSQLNSSVVLFTTFSCPMMTTDA